MLDMQTFSQLEYLAYPKYNSRVIAISSGKGGVGKTNLAVNLGLALARRNLRVALLDADLGTANADILLGIQPRYHLHHVVTGQKKLSEVIVEGPFGLQIIPGGSGLPDMADLPARDREALLHSLLLLDGAVDLLLIDTGAGVDRRVVQFVQAAGEVLVVTTPEPTAITDAYALIKVLSASHTSIDIKLVVNAVRRRGEGEATARKLATVAHQFLGKQVDLLGILPYDDTVGRAVQQQTPLVQSFPRSPVAVGITRISEQLWGGPTVPPAGSNGGGVGWFIKRFFSPKSEHTY
ncbi:MAG: MinD/ParA family protein [Anaerolineae bacterium]